MLSFPEERGHIFFNICKNIWLSFSRNKKGTSVLWTKFAFLTRLYHWMTQKKLYKYCFPIILKYHPCSKHLQRSHGVPGPFSRTLECGDRQRLVWAGSPDHVDELGKWWYFKEIHGTQSLQEERGRTRGNPKRGGREIRPGRHANCNNKIYLGSIYNFSNPFIFFFI